ncbi:MAG TPA: YicC family protein [Candidatus Marinimicrobia bacterium]|nr:YicC family protein [Candidatus Neomarinimicrobiota bacterium]
MMIKSMTGYGRSAVKNGSGQISVTVRAVNSRYFDLKIRGFDLDPALDLDIRNRTQEILKRGSIQLVFEINHNSGTEGLLQFNKSRYEAIESLLQTIQMEYGRHIELSQIVSLKDLFSENDQDKIQPKNILKGLNDALGQADEMRSTEGKIIQKSMEDQLKSFCEKIDKLEQQVKKASKIRKEKYQKKISELLETVPVDETRLAQEIAILSEKADITEEILRCRSHMEQYLSFLQEVEPVGKRLNFLLQETHREINTIGAKNSDMTLTNLVIELKNDTEKLREQAQNIL